MIGKNKSKNNTREMFKRPTKVLMEKINDVLNSVASYTLSKPKYFKLKTCGFLINSKPRRNIMSVSFY